MACDNKKLCVGCTIGPIFATLNKAKKPMEIWMASYLFSRIAEMIVDHIAADTRVNLVSPSQKGCEIAKEVKGVGLYSDHIFFEINGTDEESEATRLIADAKNAAMHALAQDIAVSSGEIETQLEKWVERLDKEIFVLSAVSCVDQTQPIPLSELTDKLDLLECYPPFVDISSAKEPDLLEKYLISMKTGRSIWVREQQVSMTRFNELMSITKQQDENQGKDTNENYVALVQADGDNVGRLLGRLSNAGKVTLIQKVSNFLFDMGKRNADAVREFGALPIYFGGDDMLFLAPVCGNDQEGSSNSVFSLIEQLENCFENAYTALLANEEELRVATADMEKPALSFGVMLCYCKYPLKLIRENAADALFSTAKSIEWTKCKGKDRSKRAVSIVLRKHSGQTSKLCLKTASKEDCGAYHAFVAMLQRKVDKLSLHALHWKIMEQPNLVAYLLMLRNKDERQARVISWLKESFNEQSPNEAEVKGICEFLCAIADDLWDGSEKPLSRDDAIETIIQNIDGAFRLFEMLGTNDAREGENQ